MHFCLPIKLKSKAGNNNNVAAGTISVNNFLEHWMKEVITKRYEDDVPILTLKTVEVYRYSDEILKHIPKDALETFEETLLYSKKKVTPTGD